MNSENILKNALRYHTLDQDFNEMINILDYLKRTYDANIFLRIKGKIKQIKQMGFANDRIMKNFMNLIKVGLLELEEMEEQLSSVEVVDNAYIRSILNSFPSLKSLV